MTARTSIHSLSLHSLLLLILLILKTTFAQSSTGYFDDLETKLTTTGLKGEIHGSNPENDLYAFTVRNPTNFFEYKTFPLTTDDENIKKELKLLKRNQIYEIKGRFLSGSAPIQHISLNSLTLVRDYSSEIENYPYVYKGDLATLEQLDFFIGRVHAIGENGKILVMEYVDRIVPVVVREASSQALVNSLYKGDLVKIHMRARSYPSRPLHVSLKPTQNLQPGESPIEVLESLVKENGLKVSKSGFLVKFPRSPIINRDVYALLVEDPNGTSIQYTLTNFNNLEIFEGITLACSQIWMSNPSGIENDRNKLVNRKIKVSANGVANIVDQSQANPQILIENLSDLKFEVID